MKNNLISAAFYRGNKTFSIEQVKLKKPGPEEVAVKIAYVGICGTDMHVYFGHMDKRVGFKRIIGHETTGDMTFIPSHPHNFFIEILLEIGILGTFSFILFILFINYQIFKNANDREKFFLIFFG